MSNYGLEYLGMVRRRRYCRDHGLSLVADVGIDCGAGGDIASILKNPFASSFTSLTQMQRALKLAHGHDRLRHQPRLPQRNAQVIHRLSTGFVMRAPCVHESAK
jgi:hypothetical protein